MPEQPSNINVENFNLERFNLENVNPTTLILPRPTDLLTTITLLLLPDNPNSLINFLILLAFAQTYHQNCLVPIAYAIFLLSSDEHSTIQREDQLFALELIDTLAIAAILGAAAWFLVASRDKRTRREGGLGWVIAGAAMGAAGVVGCVRLLEELFGTTLEEEEEEVLFATLGRAVFLGACAGLNLREMNVGARLREVLRLKSCGDRLRCEAGWMRFGYAVASALLVVSAAWVTLDFRLTTHIRHNGRSRFQVHQLDFRLFLPCLSAWTIGQILFMNLLVSVENRAFFLSANVGTMSVLMNLTLKDSWEMRPDLVDGLWIVFGVYVGFAAWAVASCILDGNLRSAIGIDEKSREIEEGMA